MAPVVRIGVEHTSPSLLTMLAAGRLVWFPEAGCGYYPVPPAVNTYDGAYFDKYKAYADTDMGRRLNAARLALVNRHYAGHLVDIGIGCGSFVADRPNTHGYDVNVKAIEWLNHRHLWWNPYTRNCRAASMWDVLEHISDFPMLLDCVREWLFVSLPVFSGPDHVLASKHYRKDEHFWYFTINGFTRLMNGLGWDTVEVNGEETEIGRDCIASFAFRRRED
jgi:methyltransferase family protein